MQKSYGRIVGWGAYAPERVLTNDDISKLVDTNDEWIVRRTGIRERHIAASHETTSTMAVAGGEAPNASAWALPYSSHREMSVTYIRVLTTSERSAPSVLSALSMISMQRLAWR